MASIGLVEIIRFHPRRPATIMKFSMQGIVCLCDGTPMTLLFSPLRIGRLHVPNPVVLAPMARSRADDAGHVGALTAELHAGAGYLSMQFGGARGYVDHPSAGRLRTDEASQTEVAAS
jgi:hypothetical protein